MPGLTVTEKSHGRDRIAARSGKAAERIRARHPALFDRVAREAHAQALASLGLADAYAELEAIKAEEATLARRKKRAQCLMVATLRGQPIDEVADSFHVRSGGELALPYEAAEAITRRQASHQDQLLADDPVGRETARLEAEKDRLLDTVWLAWTCQPYCPHCHDPLGVAARGPEAPGRQLPAQSPGRRLGVISSVG